MLFILYICFGIAFLSLIVLGIINILILPKKKILSRICFGISVFEIFLSLITFFTEFVTSGNFDVALIVLIIPFVLSASLFYLNIK